ncbi:MAG: pantoate--beta-alanine ligase [Ignavibacteriae bacterium]|nr:pantoate--beta-alanine ligase [Ignavibacteriota bacterium]
MKPVSSVLEMQRTADSVRLQGKRIGVVPTMGYLHEGHLSLIRIAKQHADVVITTIFVNPLQFAPYEDFSRYPRDIERDSRMAEEAGTDFLFIPEQNEMYSAQHLTYVQTESLTEVLEGKIRPGHFRGVTTVVAKLFNITKPHVAVFGQKDAQQALLIQQMVRDLNFDIELVIAPIVREPDGLAMSSRNVYLNPEERKQSVALSQSLKRTEELIAGGERNCKHIKAEMTKLISSQPLSEIDYLSIADTSTLHEFDQLTSGTTALISIAVRFGKTRLIDNTIVRIS